MGENRTIAAGLFALHIAQHGTLCAQLTIADMRKLKLYSPRGPAAHQLASHLEQLEGYDLSIVENTSEHFLTVALDKMGIACIIHLSNSCRRTAIDVMLCTYSTPTFPIAYSPRTHFMNIITDNAIIIAYPDLTLEGRGRSNPLHIPYPASDNEQDVASYDLGMIVTGLDDGVNTPPRLPRL